MYVRNLVNNLLSCSIVILGIFSSSRIIACLSNLERIVEDTYGKNKNTWTDETLPVPNDRFYL